ncbi:hypothetical protein DPMN_045359 [Dreissena polymorpha]|uniref:Uncharacterized protein n=1 Tax=Dreissena polymorpha TaxID=45954 RepID=A0A9D4D484_DREPO|nr:hypothetical protein DPMN_045359 [Dreissena polymorpha]
MQDTGRRTQASQKAAPHLQPREQDQLVRPEYDNSTCGSKRTPPSKFKTTNACLVWTRDQTKHTVQDCAPGHPRRRS